MNARIHATLVITKRRIFETLITPGYYIALSLGLLLGYVLVTGFVRSIDASGFDFHLHPVYDIIGRAFEAIFGISFVEQLFAEGPFLFTLYVVFLPVFFYLALSSVFKFGLEKKVGAIELLSYGPADGTAYFLALMLKDMLMTILSISVLWGFFGIAAVLNNLILGPQFFYSLPMIFFLAVTFYAYGILSSTCTENSASAIAIFLCFLVFFLILVFGTFTIASSYVRSLSTVFSWLFKWFSPFFYWGLGLRAISASQPELYVLSLLLLLILSGVILFVCHILFRAKGVRG